MSGPLGGGVTHTVVSRRDDVSKIQSSYSAHHLPSLGPTYPHRNKQLLHGLSLMKNFREYIRVAYKTILFVR